MDDLIKIASLELQASIYADRLEEGIAKIADSPYETI